MKENQQNRNIIPTQDKIDEILESVPVENRKELERLVIASSIQMKNESPEALALKSLKPEHITQYLKSADKDMEYSYKERHQSRIFAFVLVLIAMIFVVTLVILLKDNPDILEKVLYAGGGLIAGAVGGYGYGKNKSE